MSIASEITRINSNIAAAYTQVSAKGGTLPATQNSANLATAIASISGGTSGLEYEEGTFTVNADTKTPQINFLNTHNTLPAIIFVKDNTTESTVPQKGLCYWSYTSQEYLGNPLKMPTSSSSTSYYSTICLLARSETAAGIGTSTNNCAVSATNPGTSSKSYPRYFASESSFTPRTDMISSSSSIANASYLTNREYKWIAIWK